jgi:iron complex transport system permease protein
MHRASGPWDDTEYIVITTVRLPRVLAAIIAGGGLGLTGAALQGIFRNPLVGPQIIGVSNGAALGGVIAILSGASAFGVVSGAFVFALASVVCVFLLSRMSGSGSILSVVLAGVIVSSFCGAFVGLAQYFADPERQLPGIVYWMLGSFATSSWSSVQTIALPTLGAGAVLLMMRWRINLLSLGDVDAAALGVRVSVLRWIVMCLTTVMIAAQVAVSGVIGWVGLVVPHIARRIAGPNHQYLLPISALLGALYLVIIDDIARTITAQELPIGVLTALVGTPVFAVVFWRTQSRGWSRE